MELGKGAFERERCEVCGFVLAAAEAPNVAKDGIAVSHVQLTELGPIDDSAVTKLVAVRREPCRSRVHRLVHT